MRYLLVEDDTQISSFISRGLRAKGHVVEVRENGQTGLEASRAVDWDAIILDIMLPKFTGKEICRMIRQEGNTTPIIMLTALDSTNDIVQSLQEGADDYLTKPFAFDELIARLGCIQRRTRRNPAKQHKSLFTYEDLVFDRNALILKCGDEHVPMTSLEYALLEFFVDRIGQIITREDILHNVWGISHDPHTNIVDVYISRLRSKIDKNRAVQLISTIRGRGYRFGY